jgi:hypothetical protein
MLRKSDEEQGDNREYLGNGLMKNLFSEYRKIIDSCVE